MSLNLKEEISKIISGECAEDHETLDHFSTDASICVVRPKLVVYPKSASDIKKVVNFVAKNKANYPELSVTVRAAGSCMSGGSLNESIILDVTRHMHGVLKFDGNTVSVLPGTFYRDFEPETLKLGLILPCFTASKNLCALGGMIGNNCAGEKTLRYGKMEDYIEELKVVLADGNEYLVKPLNSQELQEKISQDNFEGQLYKKMHELITTNSSAIQKAKPQVSKNSSGYYLWNVFNSEVFNFCKLIVGAQGTLGIVTEAKLRLVPVSKHSKLFVIFLRDLKNLGNLVKEILPENPETVESYDDSTMKLAIRFLPEMLKSMKAKSFLKLILGFWPETLMMLTGGIPKLIVLVEFTGDTEEEIDQKLERLREKVAHFGFRTHKTKSEGESEKYWTIRRESFNLLRKHVRGMRTAPFVDDVVVRPEFLPEFLPKMRKILDDHKLLYTIAGHAGNGNFHIIPLMDFKDKKNRDLIPIISDKIFDLIKSFHGSNSGEHNDGIIRTPYLNKMYSPHMLSLFAETKHIFDPLNIFNPGKKVGGTLEYFKEHISLK
jgi:FAD/FMN-containing dehydrogenase